MMLRIMFAARAATASSALPLVRIVAIPSFKLRFFAACPAAICAECAELELPCGCPYLADVVGLRKEVSALTGTIATQGNTIDELGTTVAKHNRRHVKIVLRAAASRIEEIVVQDALSISRKQMRDARLFSIGRVEQQASVKIQEDVKAFLHS